GRRANDRESRSFWPQLVPGKTGAVGTNQVLDRSVPKRERVLWQECQGRTGSSNRPAWPTAAGNERKRSGRLDGGCERPVKPGWGSHQRLNRMLDLRFQLARAQTRRQFLKNCQAGLGAIALATLSEPPGYGDTKNSAASANPMAPRKPQFAPKAKSVIYLHMSGAPPQHELFDYKPELVKHHMQPCP